MGLVDPTTFGIDNLKQIPSRNLSLTPEERRSIEEIKALRNKSLEINSNGAKQSFLGARYDLIPPESIKQVAKTLYQGSLKYSDDNWKGITPNEHINHAIAHLFEELDGDTSENHLAHAATRLLFAIYTKLRGVRD